MKKIIKITLLVALVGLFIYTFYYLYSQSQKVDVRYTTESPFTATIIKKTVATGSVVPRKEVLIKSRVSGIIEKIFIQAGQKVKAGDVIARIKIIPDMLSLNDAESRVDRAKLQFDNSKIELDRNQQLFTSGVISKADFQPFELNFKNMQQELETAEINLQLIKEGVSAKAGGSTNTLIKSTISGTVLDVPTKEGNSVIQSNNFNDGTTIASVADLGEMIFEGKLDESEVGKIKAGMALIMTVGAIEDKKFDATLEYISPKGVSEGGAIQFQIKAAISLRDDVFLRANYSANADIVLARADSVLSINEGLLQFNGDSTFVEIETKKPQVFVKRMIKTGLSDGINIEVKSGLTKMDRIKSKEEEVSEETED